jgi:hypothetical protein
MSDTHDSPDVPIKNPKTVYFFVQGTFSNNLFQYFASEIVKKIYNYDEVKPIFTINLVFNTVIEDNTFKRIIEDDIKGSKYDLDTSKDILMWGFFQRSEIFKQYNDLIKSIFNENNTNNISNRIKICNIYKYISKHIEQPGSDDLTVHLSLESLYDKENNKSQMFVPEEIKKIIKQIPHEKLFIVTDKPENKWSQEYLEEFVELNPSFIHGNLGDNFDFILKSSKIITSADPLSWIGAQLSNAKEVHVLYNYYYEGKSGYEQHLAEMDDTRCTLYDGLTYWLPNTYE